MSNSVRWSPEMYSAHKRRQELAQRAATKAAEPQDAPTTFMVKLPWPPNVNHSHELNADGSRRLSTEARAFRENASAIARFEFAQAGYKTLRGRCEVKIDFMPPDARKRDIDGPIKQLLDALQAAEVFADDSQVKQLQVTMFDCAFAGEGAAQVVVRTL